MNRRIKRYFIYSVCAGKLGIAFFYVLLNKKRLYEKNIWLIREKHTEARDNGFHLYEFIRNNHPEINAFYSITKRNSPDREKVLAYGNVIDAETIKHYVIYLSAKYSISSQQDGACPYPTSFVKKFRFLCRKDQKVVFLQHGITKDYMPELDYETSQYDVFVCTALKEYLMVCDTLHYPKANVKLIGMCRYDNLIKKSTRKQILIMPTFRGWLVAAKREVNASKEECRTFMKSEFYKRYSKLLTNPISLSEAKRKGYKIVFYLHYSLQSYTETFKAYGNETVVIADRNHYDVQQLLLDSSVMVTDFSSVFFDFAYMKKPEIFYQFDEKEYREKHYTQGYFEYRRDAFGPVFVDENEVINYLIQLIENGCVMEETYQQKVDDFFAFRDNHNCERNFEAIKALENQ